MKIKLALILGFLVITGVTGFLVLHSELEKRQRKYAADLSYYDSQYAAWQQYQKEYKDQVNQIILENKASMDLVKSEYDKLLTQQPNLIQQHTKSVAEGTTTGGNTTVATVSNSTQTTTKTVKVTKPSSTPKTKSS